MDDVYAINVAKSELREAYNTGDVNRLLAVFHPAGYTEMSEGGPSQFGQAARDLLREQTASLFAHHSVKLTVIIIKITVQGDMAWDYGWHEFTLQPRNGGEPLRKRHRYFELWSKDPSGSWKISLHINNHDVREELSGAASHWFLSEDPASPST